MKLLRHATFGIVTVALVSAFFIACSSDDEDPQREQQTAQTQEEQQAAATEASATDQEQPRDGEQAERGQQEQRSTSRSDQPASQGQDDTSADDDRQQPQEQQTVAETPEQDEDQDQPAAQGSDESQEQQQEAQEQSEPQPQAQQQDQAEPAQSVDDSDVQQQEMQPEEDEPAQPSEPSETERLQLRAEEIRANATVPDVVGLNGWLNGEETSIALEIAKGNVVLIDFWTYTCINCVRTLPFLTAWDEKYRDHGLVIIGVHTPEFEFEERVENIRAAIAEHNIEYLVAIDNDYRTWRAFQNRWWPRKFLIGPTADGSPMGIRYDHIGEGDYPETEIAIRQALEAVGKDLSDIPIGVDVEIPTRQGGTPRQTRELYAGWSRNNGSGGPYAGQEAYFLAGPGVPTFYSDIPTSERRHNLWYLQGLWETDRESIVHARETGNLEDYIAFVVRGRTANVVLTVAEDGQPFNVYVELDGRWLHPGEAGAHIQWDDEGRSYIRVTENDLYRLIFLPEWSEHELKLRSDSDQFRIFAFTFGSYVGGE